MPDSSISPDTAALISPLGAVKIVSGKVKYDLRLKNITGAGDTDLVLEPGGFSIATGTLKVVTTLTRGVNYFYDVTDATWDSGSDGIATFTHDSSGAYDTVVGDIVNVWGVEPSAWNGAYKVATRSDTEFTAKLIQEPPAFVSAGYASLIGPGWKVPRGRLSFATSSGEHFDSGAGKCWLTIKQADFAYGDNENSHVPMDLQFVISNPYITIGSVPT